MTIHAPDWVGGLLDATTVSRERLAAALSMEFPVAWRWCEATGSGVTRRALTEALVASLTEALKLTWRECAAHTDFRPTIEVLDGQRQMLAVPLRIQIQLGPSDSPGSDAPLDVTLQLGIGHAANATVFHELRRTIAPRSVIA